MIQGHGPISKQPKLEILEDSRIENDLAFEGSDMVKNEKMISVLYMENPDNCGKNSLFPSTLGSLLKSKDISAENVSKNLSQFLNSLRSVISDLPDSCGPYDIDELSFSLSIDGSGKISLIGEVSAGIVSGITITLRKKNPT